MASSGDYDTRDEDRLPWLETVEEDYDDGPGVLRIVALIVLGLAIIAAALFGYYAWQKSRGATGTGELIARSEEHTF